MWKRSKEVPKKDADEILERWDQTPPDLQRMMVLQMNLDLDNLKTLLLTFVDQVDGDIMASQWFDARLIAAAKEATKRKG